MWGLDFGHRNTYMTPWGPVLWHGGVLAAPLPARLLANVPTKAAEDGPSARAPAVVATWGVKLVDGRSCPVSSFSVILP